MAQEQSKKQEHQEVVTESYWKLKRLFYWTSILDNPGIYLDEIKSTFEGLTETSVHIASNALQAS